MKMRSGRYAYREVTVAVTNPDHVEPRDTAATGPCLSLADRYRNGRVRSTAPPEEDEDASPR